MSISRNLTIAVGLCLLAGCGGTDTTDSPGVASIAQPTASASAEEKSPAEAKAPAERPLIRSDASEEEQTRLRDVYIDCLWANGFPRQGAVKGANGGYPADLTDFDLAPGVVEKIKKECGAKEPELPIQRAKRLDPHYADHVEANVRCLNQHGLKAVVENDAPALVNGLPSQSDGHWLDDCEREAFADYYSTLN
ncbi:hypothetical protein BJ973_004510 [Actinoplanes tereljensis]|uniref:Lipoprotein n=1 Tax=Paractinoplanes tereljensis TaxID=571912 RepID=A0A919NUA7_9ACTN|nr:hypothetical protein [Actinoplanes tereljensis]GIF23897.1 hypothetical protein Ate02nite_66270 [Actinoplanes tereljensis]